MFDVTRLQAIADDKLNVGEMMISLLKSVENIVEKGGKKADYLHFLKPFSSILIDPVLIHSVIDPGLFGWHFLILMHYS